MKKATKFLSLLLVLCFVFSLGVFASDKKDEGVPEGEYDVDAARQEAFGIITAESESKDGGVPSGSVDVYVDESAAYDSYDFDGSVYGTNNGYLTVTVDGVEVDPADLNGTYENVVFTVTGQIPAFVDGYASAYRTALYYDADGLNEELSVTAAVKSGSYDDNGGSDIVIESQNDNFEGIIVSGGEYTFDNVSMVAEGNGTNDFAGVGAGIAVGGDANVTVNGYDFIAHGIIRHGMFIGGDDLSAPPVLTINNGLILTGNPQAEDGTTMYQSDSGMSMNSSPWMLGIEPTSEVRSQLMASTGVGNYNNTTIISSGWGVVSSDAVDGPANWGEYTIQMNLTDCKLDFTGTSGYISYAIGATHNTFTNCIIGNAIGSGALDEEIARAKEEYDYDVAYESGVTAAEDGRYYNTTYALIIANETSGGTFDNCEYTGQYGVMFHKTNNVRYVPGATDNTSAELFEDGYTLLKDSTFYTQGAAILVKACTPVIYVENTKFESATDVIVQVATCDDPGMGSQYFSEVLDLSAEVAADPDYNPYDYNVKNQSIFSYKVENMINDVSVDFADCKGDTALNGNFYNSISVSTTGEGMTWFGQNLILSFDDCEINGNATSSSALHNAYSGYYDAEGNEVVAATTDEAIAAGAVEGRITSDNATYLGWLTNYPSATVNNGVWVLLSNGSVWTPNDVCYLTVLENDGSSVVNGTVTVDGEIINANEAGRWTGVIVVEPAEGAAAPEAAPAAGGTDETAYQAYLCAFVDSCEDIQTSGAAQEFKDAINAGNYVDFPVEVLFDAQWFGEAAMSYDEFVAAGGVYDIGEHASNGAMLDGTGEE